MQKNFAIIVFLVLSFLILVLALFTTPKTPDTKPLNSPSPVPTATIGPDTIEGNICGGIMGLLCPEGYSCILEGSYPDASGKCFKN